jgi:hypothetical protein
MTTITVHTSPAVSAPRAAAWAASLFSSLLNRLSVPAAAGVQRKAFSDRQREATAVREYAQRFVSYDPRFAADLFAAADRHEIAD